MAIVIHSSCRRVGSPSAANTAPKKANGKAKSVCSIFIISSVRRVFLRTVDTVGESEIGFLVAKSYLALFISASDAIEIFINEYEFKVM